ncbi:MAG: hypothetical protein COA43_15220 [Robiginitomaculum sp.]|nr:MAG: hypothetical protein COA43_15220 [Robiginitomaculum sp.]
MKAGMSNAKTVSRSISPPRYFSFPAIAGQNPWLDFLRAIAVLFVLLRHGERALMQSSSDALNALTTSPLHNFFINGWVGVDLFLVLSGYLIGKSLIKMFSKDNQINIKTYFWHRSLRIIPAYFAVLFITALGVFPLYAVSPEHLGLRVFYHMLFLQDYLPSNINVVFWSLGVEEKFYILAPLIAVILVKFKQTRSAFALMALLFLCSPLAKTFQLWSAHAEINYQTFFQDYRSPFHLSTEPLIVGFAISYFEIKKKINLTPSQAKWIFAMAAVLTGSLLFSHDFLSSFGFWDMMGQPISLALLFGTMVVCATQLSGLPVIGEPVWRLVSRLSYALYLIHFPLIPLALALTLPNAPLSFWGIYMIFAFAGALVLHFLVEKPFLKIKNRRSSKLISAR